jgi:adenine-specific DNA-methyltransferase
LAAFTAALLDNQPMGFKGLTKYDNPDNDPRGPWMSDNLTGLANSEKRPNLHYDIVNPETGQPYPPLGSRGWAYDK